MKDEELPALAENPQPEDVAPRRCPQPEDVAPRRCPQPDFERLGLDDPEGGN